MKKITLILAISFVNIGNKLTAQNKMINNIYPETKKGNVVDDYFGTKISDPYQWLENDTAIDVISWVDEQNKTTQNYLSQIPFRDKLKSRLTEIWNYPKYGSPFKDGDYYYFFKNDGLQNQSVLYRQKGISGTTEIFLDPNKLSADGTASLASLTFSKDHNFCAVGIAQSGSDWNEIFVMDVSTKQKTSDDIKWVKFSGATWHKNGFYYSRYDEPTKGKEFSNANEYMKIYYHELGKSQQDDKLIYEDKAHPLRYFNASVTEDERYLFINVSEGTSGSEILVRDLTQPNSKFITLFKGFDNNYNVVDNIGDRILALTDFSAPRYRLVLVDPLNSDAKNWKDIIPQGTDLLEGVSTCGGKLFATYLKDASTRLYSYDMNGQNKKEIIYTCFSRVHDTSRCAVGRGVCTG
jgi:prolyl oligopeptidase